MGRSTVRLMTAMMDTNLLAARPEHLPHQVRDASTGKLKGGLGLRHAFT
jgi:hypothetical protein